MKVYVHTRGARHLSDPSKLIESAGMVYGNQKAVLDMHGEILPVPNENIIPLTENELDIGNGIRLTLFDAPGHASHHIGIFEPESGCLFSGEALGHYLPELDLLQPAVAPPGFSLQASLSTIKAFEGLHPKTICFSQYAVYHDPAFVIREAIGQLQFYHDMLLPYFRAGLDTKTMIQKLINHFETERGTHEGLTDPMLTSIVTGYQIYFQRTYKSSTPAEINADNRQETKID